MKHIRKWLEWRKLNTNSRWHKFLVLIKARKSPSFIDYYRAEQLGSEISEGLKAGLESAVNPEIRDTVYDGINKVLARMATYEKNRETKGIFYLDDDLEVDRVIKAFLLSKQKKEDLDEMLDAFNSMTYFREDYDEELIDEDA